MRESARTAPVARPSRNLLPMLAWLSAGLLPLACSSQPQAPHGSPVLVGVFWVTGSAHTQVWGADPDAGAGPVPPGASQVDFVFDRRLDGARVEDTVGNMTVAKASPPITAGWPEPDSVMSDPPFAADVFYNSVPLYGGQSAYVFLRPRAVGFPSATAVTFALDPTGLTSAYGEPMVGPSSITVTTDHLGVLPRPPSGANGLDTFPPTFQLPVQFTARPTLSRVAAFTRATANGEAVPVRVAADAVDPTIVHVSSACAGGWPAGTRVDVSFDAGLPDAFGVPTDAPLPAGSFQVSGDADAAGQSDCTN